MIYIIIYLLSIVVCISFLFSDDTQDILEELRMSGYDLFEALLSVTSIIPIINTLVAIIILYIRISD